MKKRIVIISTILLSIFLLIAFFTGGFRKGIISGKIYRPQNVYEEIWNLVLIEQHTEKQTVLTSSTKDAYVDFDFGFHFVGVIIPECNVTISWWKNDGKMALSFMFPLDNGEYAHFIYSYETKTLFGDTDFSYLTDKFLTDYFEWCETATDFSSEYSIKELGVYTFQYENPIYYY